MSKAFIIFISIIALISCFKPFPVPNKSTIKLLLDLHNKERSEIGLYGLSWSDDLALASQKWANYLASTRQFYHSYTPKVGENIAQTTFRANSVSHLFGQWSVEKNYFDPTKKFGKDSTTNANKDVTHYTQIIWSMTYLVGCGVANSTSKTILVCQYSYAGNFLGNWVYQPDTKNVWKAAQPVVNPARLPLAPTPNTYPNVLDSATIRELLDLHNIERKFVGMKDLTWSTTLAASAQAHANKQAKAGTFSLSRTSGVGENMQSASIRADVVSYMFNVWSKEKLNFDATKPFPTCSINGKTVSHYTQIVWSTTTSVGCGLATNAKNSILVCQYSGPGNYKGRYAVSPSPKVNFKFTP